jgi:hypothetical protein
MVKKKPRVFIVILNWNRKDDSLATLESIQGLNLKRCELTTLLVDNGSTDGSDKVLKSFKSKVGKYRYVQNKENLGFAEGNNVGMRHSLNKGADFVMLLNDDTILDKNLVNDLLEVFSRFPKAGILAPKIFFAKGFEFHKNRYKKDELGQVIWYAGGDMDWKNIYGTNHGVDEVDKGQFNSVVDTDFATGCCMLIRREVLKEIGLFDKAYFAYIEDADLSQRAKKAGWRVLYAPPAKLWHKVSQSSGIGSDLNDYFITRNRLIFGMRYAGLRTKFALLRESLRLLSSGRRWQKTAIRDYYLGRLGKGSWQ